jgi:hypothetical protein
MTAVWVFMKLCLSMDAIHSACWVHSTHHQMILEANSYVCSNDEAEMSCDYE